MQDEHVLKFERTKELHAKEELTAQEQEEYNELHDELYTSVKSIWESIANKIKEVVEYIKGVVKGFVRRVAFAAANSYDTKKYKNIYYRTNKKRIKKKQLKRINNIVFNY